MARATIQASHIWGILTSTIIAGDGLGSGPNVSSVAVANPNYLRVVFDRPMMQDGYLFCPDNYRVSKTGDPLSTLAIFGVVSVSGRQDAVDLIIQDQEAAPYSLEVGVAGPQAPVRDSYGTILASGFGAFMGQAPATVAYSNFHAFSGLEAGMEVKEESGWDPDLDAPYLDNLSPVPGQIDVDYSTTIMIDILDDTSGVDDMSVWIKVDGSYAWRLGAAQPGFTVIRAVLPKGFRYQIHRTIVFPGAYTVLVEVHADDLAAIPNSLTTSYSFRTIGDSAEPFLRNRDPGVDVGGVGASQSFSFDVLDDYSGVAPLTLYFFVNGAPAYIGATQSWVAPFDGYVGRVEDVDGYDGYHVRIDHPALSASSRVDLRVVAQDGQGNLLDETYGFWIAPALLSVAVDPYETTLRVTFSGAMDPTLLLDASMFALSDGAYARKAEMPAPDQALLWVERFQGAGPFELTVSDSLLDIHGGALAGDRTRSVEVFQSDALFSNTDGLVRSWRVSRQIARDAQRVYLAGLRGLDVLDIRYGITRASRWSQILDAYGISAMCLTGDGYDFSEGEPPTLTSQDPAPGSIVPSPTTIRFLVVDAVTSVETTSLAVYIGSRLVFSGGSSGWLNGWGGQVSVSPHQLAVELFPPAGEFLSGETVSVRVMATDLLGNAMDRTYQFTIA